MTALVTKHLPLVAGASDGIKRLRQLILELAVRGKLVTQIASDGKAEDLLDEIKKQLAVNFIASRGKKTSNGHFINDDEVPFTIPPSWRWTNISEITSYVQRGKGPVYAEKSEYPVISQKCVRWTGLDLGPARFIDPESIDKYEPVRRIVEGDILWNSTGTGTIGRACVVRKTDLKNILVADSHVTVVRCVGVLPDFLWRWIQTSTVQRQIESAASGSTNQIELNTSTVLSHFVPIPPLAEQDRIVAKVDELMALCDKLEADQADAESAHTQLVQAMLESLTQAKDAEDFQENWRRLSDNFHTIFTTEASIDFLKQSILQIGVNGKLVPQLSTDEAAQYFLKSHNINAVEHAKLQGWSVTDLGALGDILGGATPNKANPSYWDGDIPWVSPKDMKRSEINDAVDHVSTYALSESSLKEIPPNSILMVVRGMILAHSFPVAITKRIVTINQDMKALVPPIEISRYILLYLQASKRQIVDLVERSGHGTCKLISEDLRAFKVSIPPLAEQHRILAKVDGLMALCDRLKANLTETRQRHSQLATVLVEEATA